MKLFLSINIIYCFTFFSCTKPSAEEDRNANSENIILAGVEDIKDFDNYVPLLYDGNKKIYLQKPLNGSYLPNKVFVDGNDIYVIGVNFQLPLIPGNPSNVERIAFWKNGILQPLSNLEGYVANSTTITDIYIKESVIYSLGYNGNNIYVWKNGRILYQKNLPYHTIYNILEVDDANNIYFIYESRNPSSCIPGLTPPTSTCSVQNGIFKNNFSIYWSKSSPSSDIPGYSYEIVSAEALHHSTSGANYILVNTTSYTGLAAKGNMKKWQKNNSQELYFLAPPQQNQYVHTSGTYFSNDTIYTAGYYQTSSNYVGGYWINGTPFILNDIDAPFMSNIVSKNGIVYVAGVSKTNDNTVFWKNGKATSIKDLNNFNSTYIFVK